MEYSEMLNGIVTFWYNAYMFDLEVFTNKWMYIPLLIPIFCYIWFFFLKWVILTFPIWGPIKFIVHGILGCVKFETKQDK